MNLKSCSSMLFTILPLLMDLNNRIAHALSFEDMNIEYINPDYVDMNTFNVTIGSIDGMTTISARVDIIKDIPSDSYVQVTASTQAFGHDIPAGLSFKSNLCGDKKAEILYDIAFKPFGVNECPPKKGSYEASDVPFDFSKINLPIMKGGRIQFVIEAFGDGDTRIVKVNTFVST